jgi:hypothetical protein
MTMNEARWLIPPRDAAFAGVFGASALLLPVVFHLLHFGSLFLPMYLPLMALGLAAGPRAAAGTGVFVPLLSALLTGMPPFSPPIAPAMSMEIGLMAGTFAFLRRRSPDFPVWGHLAPVLIAGRVLSAGLAYGFAKLLDLPTALSAGISFFAGWPGVLLMLVVIPSLARWKAIHHGN